MFISVEAIRRQLRQTISDRYEQGHALDVPTLQEEVDRLAAAGDINALLALAQTISEAPLRPDWAFDEPSDLEAIWAACDPNRPTTPLVDVNLADSAARVEAAFLASVCGCQLGKPVEVNPSLAELKAAGEAVGEWPLNDYISEAFLTALDRRHESWSQTARERLLAAAADDDLNYTVMGMLLLEEHGLNFSVTDVARKWFHHLPLGWCFGPERTMNFNYGFYRFGVPDKQETIDDHDHWVTVMNPGDELCGALIRADAYGYACPGDPALAARLAWQDAAFTHRRTGIYGTMYVAAAIALAQVCDDRLEVFRLAAQYVPRQSRFHHIIQDSFEKVAAATSWEAGYQAIHGQYGRYSHCRIYQEVGTLINTLKFARDVGHGICLQVMQGNDTDSFGATAGSILGAYFGPGHLEERWLKPLNNTVHIALADFHEKRLDVLAGRMSRLPGLIAERKLEA